MAVLLVMLIGTTKSLLTIYFAGFFKGINMAGYKNNSTIFYWYVAGYEHRSTIFCLGLAGYEQCDRQLKT